MLTVSDLYKSFDDNQVLRGVSFKVPDCQILGLIGPSGGGKSILLKCIAGVCKYSRGEIDSPQLHGADIALMFQEGALFDSLSVFDNVAFPLVGGRVPSVNLPSDIRDGVYEKVSAVLAKVGLTRAAHKMPGQISGGMRRRASLARALVARPKLLLLDDPTSGLDPVASSVIMNLIKDLHADYRPTTIVVSHDLRRLLPLVERVLGLFSGIVAFDGTLSELAASAAPAVQQFVACRYDLHGNEGKGAPPSHGQIAPT